MRRSFIPLLALAILACAGAAQAAEPYVDQANRFRLTPPEGWILKPVDDGGELKLNMASADDMVECNVTISQPPNLAGVSQSLMDTSFRRGDADGVIKNEIAELSLKTSDYSQTLIERDGHPAIYASFAVVSDKQPAWIRKLFMAGSGRTYNLNCTTYAATEGGYLPALDGLYASWHLIY